MLKAVSGVWCLSYSVEEKVKFNKIIPKQYKLLKNDGFSMYCFNGWFSPFNIKFYN